MTLHPNPPTPKVTTKKYRDYYRQYLWSKVAAPFIRTRWKDVTTVVLFVGYPRTGASMVGALLDAHPDMAFAQDFNLISANEAGFSRDQIFALMLRNSRQFAETGAKGKGHVLGSKYIYAVPGQWQGRYRKLTVVGDKQAPAATKHLTRDPGVAAKLARDLGSRVRMIHMIRNPFDCINGIYRLKGNRRGPGRHPDIRHTIHYFFRLVDAVHHIHREYHSDILDVRLEDLIAAPVESLRRICEFLGVSASEDYLRDCSSIVFPAPQSVADMKWTPEDIDLVLKKIADVPFLRGYTVPPTVEARHTATG